MVRNAFHHLTSMSQAWAACWFYKQMYTQVDRPNRGGTKHSTDCLDRKYLIVIPSYLIVIPEGIITSNRSREISNCYLRFAGEISLGRLYFQNKGKFRIDSQQRLSPPQSIAPPALWIILPMLWFGSAELSFPRNWYELIPNDPKR